MAFGASISRTRSTKKIARGVGDGGRFSIGTAGLNFERVNAIMKTFLNLKQPQAFTALMTFVFGGVVSMMAGVASADNRCIGMDDSCAKEKTSNDKTQVKNVLETPLAMCSQTPLTGWFRDGYCKTDANDHGRHLVCARMTETFLSFTKGRGNDLSTPKPRDRFPGLKPGDQWCLCTSVARSPRSRKSASCCS